jgi:hypothetical protein
VAPRAPRAALPRRGPSVQRRRRGRAVAGGRGRRGLPFAAGPRPWRPGNPQCTAALFGLLGALALLTGLACQRAGGPERVRGVVVGVEARSIARADGLTLRAAGGQEYHFRVDPGVDWTPGHLREHMALAEPIVVEFTRQSDGLLATRIDDG